MILIILAMLLQNPEPKKMDCPMHEQHVKDQSLESRGEHAMGFSQTETTHHFLLRPDGGVIQVEANRSDDSANKDMIRVHLRHIATAFQAGDFDIPMFVHDTVPPGVPDMKKLQSKISYSYEETAQGGRVVIVTKDADAKEAVHKFLRFQIEEHKTGDRTETR
ncbi:MAG: hypothetical protein ABSH13_09685 [Candidatus Acidiferrum sp.]|jgi:hypothetical protein